MVALSAPNQVYSTCDPDPDDGERLTRLLSAADDRTEPWAALRLVCTAFVAGHEEVISVRRRLVAESPELDQYHRTAHHHVEIALLEWARTRIPGDPFAATLLAQSAAAVLTSAFDAWQPDDDPVRLVTLVGLGFDLIAEGLVISLNVRNLRDNPPSPAQDHSRT